MKLSAFHCCNKILEKINLKSRKVYLGSRLWRIQPVVGCSFVHGFACGEVACHHKCMTGCSPHGQEWKGEAEGALGCWPSPQEDVPPANSTSDSTGWGPELSALHPRPLSVQVLIEVGGNDQMEEGTVNAYWNTANTHKTEEKKQCRKIGQLHK